MNSDPELVTNPKNIVMNLFNEFMFHFRNWYLMFLAFVQMLFILPLSLFFFPEIIVDSHTLARNNTEKLHSVRGSEGFLIIHFYIR